MEESFGKLSGKLPKRIQLQVHYDEMANLLNPHLKEDRLREDPTSRMNTGEAAA